ncbi:peptide deformylase, partial [Patescibacteria group bacterium]|nr:peptide deformylase [Patescibacteria group bacterium]
MKEEDGAGIAAPQVGKNIRVIIVDTGLGPRAYINPQILEKSEKMIDSTEGCLSVPGIFASVSRHKKVFIQALDRNGNVAHIKKSGVLSTVFQHEIDHLDGILFIDKVDKIFKE